MEASDGARLVVDRGRVRQIISLGIRANDKEIPDGLTRATPLGWWIAQQGRYAGSAWTLAADGSPDEDRDAHVGGTVATVVVEGRLLGIVSPNGPAEPSLWFSVALPGLRTTTSGEQGHFRKRPAEISLTFPWGSSLTLAGISQLFRHSGAYQSGREGTLLTALRV